MPVLIDRDSNPFRLVPSKFFRLEPHNPESVSALLGNPVQYLTHSEVTPGEGYVPLPECMRVAPAVPAAITVPVQLRIEHHVDVRPQGGLRAEHRLILHAIICNSQVEKIERMRSNRRGVNIQDSIFD